VLTNPAPTNWNSQSARGCVQLPNLEVLINSISEQLFAPRQKASKPIVGAQVFKINFVFNTKLQLQTGAGD
ncbi:MAG: hypothetical protein AB7V37_11690, partial [Eubacteriaceae bacterium]